MCIRDRPRGIGPDRPLDFRCAPDPRTCAEARWWPAGRLQRDTITGPEIVGVRLTAAAAYAHGLALALPEKVVMARPTGAGHASATHASFSLGPDDMGRYREALTAPRGRPPDR